MFPLRTRSFPPNADALRDALEESLHHVLQPAGNAIVTVEDRNYPEIAALRVSIDNTTAGDQPPRFGAPAGPVEPALRVEHFEVRGQPVHVKGAAVYLLCLAQEVEIGQGRDGEGNLLLLLQRSARGNVELSLLVRDLNLLVRSAASAAAAKQGVIIEDFELSLRAEHERALDLEARIRARKLFLNTEVRITGKTEIDEQLNARISNLECFAEGTLGTLACGFLGPYLQRFNNQSFSLLAPPLTELKLRDVRIAVDDELRVHAQFGGDQII